LKIKYYSIIGDDSLPLAEGCFFIACFVMKEQNQLFVRFFHALSSGETQASLPALLRQTTGSRLSLTAQADLRFFL